MENGSIDCVRVRRESISYRMITCTRVVELRKHGLDSLLTLE